MSKVTLRLGFVLLQFLVLATVNAQGFGQCPISEVCIPIRECQPLIDILEQKPLTSENREFLLRSQCGLAGRYPKVCCPPARTNPDTGRNVDFNVRNNSLLPQDCGPDLSLRILGGEHTELDEYTWLTLLEYRTPNGTLMVCGGILISRRYVVTAAHCIESKIIPKSWSLTGVRLGEYDTSTERDCISDGVYGEICAPDPVTVGIDQKIVHELYDMNDGNYKHDIALLRLSRDVNFTDYIQPICLPENESVPQILHVTGWGITEYGFKSPVKLKLSLNLYDITTCSQKYRNIGVNVGAGQICAGGKRWEDACRGDSGGPLMSIERSTDGFYRWTAVGIVSFGKGNCGVWGWPSVYTKIYDYVPWILNNIRA